MKTSQRFPWGEPSWKHFSKRIMNTILTPSVNVLFRCIKAVCDGVGPKFVKSLPALVSVQNLEPMLLEKSLSCS